MSCLSRSARAPRGNHHVCAIYWAHHVMWGRSLYSRYMVWEYLRCASDTDCYTRCRCHMSNTRRCEKPAPRSLLLLASSYMLSAADSCLLLLHATEACSFYMGVEAGSGGWKRWVEAAQQKHLSAPPINMMLSHV